MRGRLRRLRRALGLGPRSRRSLGLETRSRRSRSRRARSLGFCHGGSRSHLLSPLECGRRSHCRNNITLIAGIESVESRTEVRIRTECNRAAILDVLDRLVWSETTGCHQKHGERGGRALHSCGAVNKNRLACLVLPCELQNNFIRPELEVADFIRLEVIIHGNSVLALCIRDERNIFSAIEDGLDAVLAEPVTIRSGLITAEPHAWYNFVGGIGPLEVCHSSCMSGVCVWCGSACVRRLWQSIAQYIF